MSPNFDMWMPNIYRLNFPLLNNSILYLRFLLLLDMSACIGGTWLYKLYKPDELYKLKNADSFKFYELGRT